MNNISIYRHIFPNGKVYIGQTCQKPEYRWGNGKGYKTSPFIFNAINKYGWDNIEHQILFSNLDQLNADIIEEDLIYYYKQIGKSYNLATGGKVNRGWKMSEEAKEKLSEAHKGKKKSPLSEEAKKNISNGRKGKGIGRSVVITEETKQKMSEAKKGKYKGGKHPKAKKIICENIEFDCIKDCADFYRIPKTTMTAWLNGRAKMRQDFVEKGLRYK